MTEHDDEKRKDARPEGPTEMTKEGDPGGWAVFWAFAWPLVRGALFVVVTLGLWWLFGALTSWVGTDLFFEGVLVTAGGGGDESVLEVISAWGRRDEPLPWWIAILLLLIAIWVSAQAFFPGRPGPSE